MIVKRLNKNLPNNGMKETETSCEGLSPTSLGMQGQLPGSRNQATTNKTPLNADNKDNVIVLEEEWEYLFGNSKEITSLMGFHVNHQMKMKMILISTTTIRKDKHGQRPCKQL